MREYISFLVNETGVLDEASIDRENDVYKRWMDQSGSSAKEFLAEAVGNGWIADGAIRSGNRYLTTEEMYVLLMESMVEKTEADHEFEKLLFKWLLFEDLIQGRDICRLLYDQQILPVIDDDYEKLISGEIDAFSCLKRKIEQLEVTPAQLALDPCSASAVVVQQDTGKVLALVSYPGYDSNRLATVNDMDYTDASALSRLQRYSTYLGLDKKAGVEIAEAQPHVTDA